MVFKVLLVGELLKRLGLFEGEAVELGGEGIEGLFCVGWDHFDIIVGVSTFLKAYLHFNGEKLA